MAQAQAFNSPTVKSSALTNRKISIDEIYGKNARGFTELSRLSITTLFEEVFSFLINKYFLNNYILRVHKFNIKEKKNQQYLTLVFFYYIETVKEII